MISITKTENPKQKPANEESLGFGKLFTDHMLIIDCSPEDGWHNARIVPYAPLALDPAAMCLHYGQELFEGLKAYRGEDGKVRLFRARDNIKRLNSSCERLYIPQIDENLVYEGIVALIRTDADWVPKSPDASLYIRPFIVATDPYLGVHASKNYVFVTILSPVGSYYAGGVKPTNIYVETEDSRVPKGGMGNIKAAANYASTIRAQERAGKRGFTQVIWLDSNEHKYIEEIGTSNAFFVINGTVITPALKGTVLPGITRRSCLELLRSWQIPVEERDVSIDEILAASESGTLSETFSSGTAAVISPVGNLNYMGKDIKAGPEGIGEIASRLYDTLRGIQWGRLPDGFGWTSVVCAIKNGEDKGDNINNFLDLTGKLTQYPTKRAKQTLALEYLAGKFEPDKIYTEREVNELLSGWHTFGDKALLRRELCDGGYLQREPDGSAYKLRQNH